MFDMKDLHVALMQPQCIFGVMVCLCFRHVDTSTALKGIVATSVVPDRTKPLGAQPQRLQERGSCVSWHITANRHPRAVAVCVYNPLICSSARSLSEPSFPKLLQHAVIALCAIIVICQ